MASGGFAALAGAAARGDVPRFLALLVDESAKLNFRALQVGLRSCLADAVSSFKRPL